MKVVLLVGSQANQRTLARRMAAAVPVAAIVSVTPRAPVAAARRKRLAPFVNRVAGATVGRPLRRAWFAMLGHYERLDPAFPLAPALETDDVNAPAVLRLIEEVGPDLVVVSGTNLLKPPLIERIARTGQVMNLHTGLSPYIKGGPNCTNWCLALRRIDLIGNTVMWLDAGIDSGAIVATERTPLTGRETLAELHVAVMEHAHDLYVRCVARLAAGVALPKVPQAELGEGRLFLTRHWTAAPIARAVWNFRRHYRNEATAPPDPNVRLVALEHGPRPA